MKAYHNDVAVKEKYIKRVKAHRGVREFILNALDRSWLTVNFDNGAVLLKCGKPMKTVNKGGYIVGTVYLNGARMQVKAHQVVWMAAHRRQHPFKIIDHINGIKTDNRLCNLRLVSAAGNARNRRSYSGIGNPAAKINHAMADNIRTHYLFSHSYAKTSTEFNVSRSLVAQIVRKEAWI